MICLLRQLNEAAAPGNMAFPSSSSAYSIPSHFSLPDDAKRSERCFWAALSTLMENVSALLKTSYEARARPTQNKSSGGVRDTEVNEFAVRPHRSRPSRAVMTVTPVA